VLRARTTSHGVGILVRDDRPPTALPDAHPALRRAPGASRRGHPTAVPVDFDEDLSAFRAESLLDCFLRELGPPVYNQGVRDAASFVQGKLLDIEGEIFEREPPT
jgi:uncharacterized protein (DUF2164 family)